MDLCIVDYQVEIPTRCSFVIEFIIPKFFEGSNPTSVVKPDGCIRFVQFPFGVLISVYIYGLFGVYKFDTHGSVHRRLVSRNTNKMQFCNRIYYSKVF